MKNNQRKRLTKLFIISMFVVALVLSTALPGKTNTVEAAGFKYSSKVPLSKANQKYLYDLCVKRGLNYKHTLAVIKHESNFKAKAKGGSNYGLFQINKVNHKNLAKVTKTKNSPYNVKVNMNWGTYMLTNLQKKYAKKGYIGTALREAVL
ncbi:transglycosylase SLT domain-containing protein, partial [Sharpea azabuensis]